LAAPTPVTYLCGIADVPDPTWMIVRLLFVSHSFPLAGQPLSNVGGMQRVAVELHDALDAHPDVELSSLLLRSTSRWTGFRTAPFLAGLLRRIPRVVREREIEAVVFSSMVTASVMPLLRKELDRRGVAAVAIPLGRDVTLPSRAYQRLLPSVLRSLDLLLPISRATAGECIARGAPAGAVEVVPCGVDVSRLPLPADRGAARSELLGALHSLGHSLPPDALLLLSVGRHQERKGFHWFVEHVVPTMGPDVVYLLAGSGPMTGRIRSSVARLGLQSRVKMLGQVSDEALGVLYRGADLFVMPNVEVPGDMEGFGVVMLEAGVSGLPVIAADLEGIRDVIAEGHNGHLVPTGSAADFIGGIERYLDRRLLASASRAAAAHAATKFAWPSIAECHLEVIRDACRRLPARGGRRIVEVTS
jgi:phosphatidyl-myo-inositol dimannoside synthase